MLLAFLSPFFVTLHCIIIIIIIILGIWFFFRFISRHEYFKRGVEPSAGQQVESAP